METLSVKQAAARLGVSTRTIRRRIKAGELEASLTDGPYGQEYRIPLEAIQTAQTVTDVIAFNRQADVNTLALAVAQAISETQKATQAELEALRQQIRVLTDTVDKQTQALEASRQLLEARKPWYKRFFTKD
jgi:MerR family copper efflux transcriptional regulator